MPNPFAGRWFGPDAMGRFGPDTAQASVRDRGCGHGRGYRFHPAKAIVEPGNFHRSNPLTGHTDPLGSGARKVDTSSAHIWATIVDSDHDRTAIDKIGYSDVRA